MVLVSKQLISISLNFDFNKNNNALKLTPKTMVLQLFHQSYFKLWVIVPILLKSTSFKF